MSQHYVSKPGGVIVRMADGTSKSLGYGAPVPVDALADHQKQNLGNWADTTFRGQSGDARLEAAAHARAAASQYQPNSSSSPVPSNYSDLSEDEAVQVVARYADNPDAQAAIIVHEQLYGGNRQKVVDAAAQYAQGVAASQIDQLSRHQGALERQRELLGKGEGEPFLGAPQSSKPDTAVAGNIALHQMEREAEAQNLTPPPATSGTSSAAAPAGADATTPVPSDPNVQTGPGGSSDDDNGVEEQVAARHEVEREGTEASDFSDEQTWTKANLHAYAEQHQIETNQSDKRDVLVQKIQAAGHAKPQTPPPSN